MFEVAWISCFSPFSVVIVFIWKLGLSTSICIPFCLAPPHPNWFQIFNSRETLAWCQKSTLHKRINSEKCYSLSYTFYPVYNQSHQYLIFPFCNVYFLTTFVSYTKGSKYILLFFAFFIGNWFILVYDLYFFLYNCIVLNMFHCLFNKKIPILGDLGYFQYFAIWIMPQWVILRL